MDSIKKIVRDHLASARREFEVLRKIAAIKRGTSEYALLNSRAYKESRRILALERLQGEINKISSREANRRLDEIMK